MKQLKGNVQPKFFCRHCNRGFSCAGSTRAHVSDYHTVRADNIKEDIVVDLVHKPLSMVQPAKEDLCGICIEPVHANLNGDLQGLVFPCCSKEIHLHCFKGFVTKY